MWIFDWFKPSIEKLKARKDIEGLIRALKSRNSDIRYKASKALGELRDEKAVEPLINVLEDESKRVKLQAVVALGRIGDVEAIEPLIKLLDDPMLFPSPDELIDSIAHMGKPSVVPLLTALNNNHNLDWSIRQILLKMEKSGVEPLRMALHTETMNTYIKHYVAGLLVDLGGWPYTNNIEQVYCLFAEKRWGDVIKMGKSAVEPLTQILMDDSQNSDVRAESARIIGEIGDTSPVQILLGILVAGLGQWNQLPSGGRVTERQLQSFSKSYTNVNIRKEVACALGKIGDKKAIGTLIRYLDDWNKRLYGGRSYAETSRSWVEHIGPSTDDKDVVLEVIKALGKMGDEGALKSLEKCLPNSDTNALALEAIKNIRGRKENKE